MKHLIFITCIAAFGLISEPIFCQNILERMAKKATKEAEKNLEKKAEQKTDEQLEKAFEEQEPEETPPNTGSINLSKMMEKMGATSNPIDIEDHYSFNSSITIEIKTYDADGKLTNDGEMITYITPNTESYAYQFISGKIEGTSQNTKGVVIMDMKNEACIILSDDGNIKTGIAYGMKNMMNDEAWNDEEEEENMPDNILADPNIKKTGRTKVILGYKCDEYLHEDDNSKTSFWMTKDIKWDSKDLVGNIFKTPMYSQGLPWGFLMESNTEENDTGEKSTYLVKDINKKAHKEFILASYNVTNLGSINMPTNPEE